MKGKDFLTLGFTFLFGVFAGFYGYITSYAPTHNPDSVAEKSDMRIVGEMYGGCEKSSVNTCGSFRIDDDGSYSYIASAGASPQQGQLPSSVRTNIFSVLTEMQLHSYTNPAARQSCSSDRGGIDYQYKITLKDSAYTLDTCTTAFPRESKLSEAFLEAWKYMNDPVVTYPTFIEEGLGGYLIDRFQNP